MVLKRNILSALFFLFYILSVHSVDYGDYGSCFEPFDVSCIKFSNENIIVVTHNIRCNETTVENEYILLMSTFLSTSLMGELLKEATSSEKSIL